MLTLAEKAAEYGWIPTSPNSGTDKKSDIISLQEIKEKIEKDTLVIGVIGQMKCGKSTFLNSFVFENDILPAATTPMTAALSIITYGEKEHIVAEFYTKDEWEEQKYQASRSLDDVNNSLDESKVKAAKDLVKKSSNLGTSIESYLGKTKEDKLDQLIEYVGADGKYVAITKSVTIYYPKEYLKGVEIVDTPGFNDPIVSREERTKAFLKKADVVLMMLYAGRPFDSTDRDILFKNVRQCGIGKVIVGINKYDIPFCDDNNPEDESKIKAYVSEEIRKACKECNDNKLNEILKDTEPIPLSAEMALLSCLPMSKISASENLSEYWQRHCSNFGISTQSEMRQYSHIDDLAEAIKAIVFKEKDKILFTKPLNAIFAAGNKKKSDIEKDLGLTKEKIENLLLPDNELEDKEEALSKAKRRMDKKIESLGDDIESELHQILRKGKNELEDIVDASVRKMTSILEDEWPVTKGYECVQPKIEAEIDTLFGRSLKYETQDISDQCKRKIDSCVSEFFLDAEDILMRFVPEFDSRSFVKSIKNQIKIEIEEDLFDTSYEGEEIDDYGLLDGLADFLNGATFGVSEAIGNILSHNKEVSEALSGLNKVRASFNPQPYLEAALNSKDEIINTIKQRFITELLEPLQDQITDIRGMKETKAAELEKLKTHRETLNCDLSIIDEQMQNISQMNL